MPSTAIEHAENGDAVVDVRPGTRGSGTGASAARPPNRFMAWVRSNLFPVDRARHGLAPILVLIPLMSMLALFRALTAGWRGVLWAEDSNVFLQEHLDDGLGGTLLRPYAGYLHVVPRLIMGATDLMSTYRIGQGINLLNALGIGITATVAWYATAAIIRVPLVRAVVPLAVVLVPLGSEMVVSAAYLQWYMLPVGVLCALWTPTRLLPWLAATAFMLLTTLSSPFGALIAGVCLVKLLFRRDRANLTQAALVTAATVIQLGYMLSGDREPRQGDITGATFWIGYAQRVLSDGVLGVQVWSEDRMLAGTPLGIAVISTVGALILLTALARNVRAALIALALSVLGVVAYAGPVLIALPPLAYRDLAERYYAPAVILLAVTILVLTSAALESWKGTGVVTKGLRVLCGVVAMALLWPTLFGLGSSLTSNVGTTRELSSSWSDQIPIARDLCVRDPGLEFVEIQNTPIGYITRMPCDRLRAEVGG